jgi:hypothetical protein
MGRLIEPGSGGDRRLREAKLLVGGRYLACFISVFSYIEFESLEKAALLDAARFHLARRLSFLLLTEVKSALSDDRLSDPVPWPVRFCNGRLWRR